MQLGPIIKFNVGFQRNGAYTYSVHDWMSMARVVALIMLQMLKPQIKILYAGPIIKFNVGFQRHGTYTYFVHDWMSMARNHAPNVKTSNQNNYMQAQ